MLTRGVNISRLGANIPRLGFMDVNRMCARPGRTDSTAKKSRFFVFLFFVVFTRLVSKSFILDPFGTLRNPKKRDTLLWPL